MHEYSPKMTRKTKVYKIKLPLTIKEWRKGSRYILSQLTTDDVKIVIHRKEPGYKELKTITHKILDISKKVPYIIKKVLPEQSLILEEHSVNIDLLEIKMNKEKEITEEEVYNIEDDKGVYEKIKLKMRGIIEKNYKKDKENDANEISNFKEKDVKSVQENTTICENKEINIKEEMMNYCETKYKNAKYDEKTFKLQINTLGSKKELNNAFELDNGYKEVEIDFRKHGKKNLKNVGTRDYSGDWTKRYPSMYLYKFVEVEINSFGFGWITKEIDKILKNFLVDVQLKIIESYYEWINLSNDEMEKLERQMINKFLVKCDNK